MHLEQQQQQQQSNDDILKLKNLNYAVLSKSQRHNQTWLQLQNNNLKTLGNYNKLDFST